MNNEDSESTLITAVSVIIKQDRNQVLKKRVEANLIRIKKESTTIMLKDKAEKKLLSLPVA